LGGFWGTVAGSFPAADPDEPEADMMVLMGR